MTSKMHENHSKVLYLQYQRCVKKLEKFIDWAKIFAKLRCLCQNVVRDISRRRPDTFSRPSLRDNNFGSIIDRKMFFTPFDRYLLGLL